MKIIKWIYNNLLLIVTLFLLAFIPLYPKKPILDIVNTWVYVRAEDFVVAFVLLAFVILLFRRKISLKTPITLPILLFWIVGGLSTIHGVLLIFPEISNVFPNVAFLSMLRRIEYMSLFFVAYSALKGKKSFPYFVWAVVLTLLGVVVYGMGQRYLGFPAYLTMNEEFAKGIPIQLSSLSRVPSTFAGHYDLAAYLVLVIPITVSLIFGFKNWLARIFLGFVSISAFVLLYFTVSRVSFFVLLLTLVLVLFIHKRKLVLFSLPFAAAAFFFLIMNYAPRLVDRFDSTVKEVDVLVDATTGEALGSIREVKRDDFRDRVVRLKKYSARENIDAKTTTRDDELLLTNTRTIVPFIKIPAVGVQLVPPNASTGETLPQGTGYINLSLSPVKKQYGEFFYEQKDSTGTQSAEVQMYTGRFVVKRAAAYDLSLTTRYQGEWPHALEAFKRNVFLGSGYSSIGLAVDNSYLRMLGEIGVMGFVAFAVIFVVAGIYIKKVLSDVDSPLVKSFVIGFSAGVVGLILNATLIDVFEASKVAFYLWLLMGITLSILHQYKTRTIEISSELKKIATSTPAVIVYLGVVVFLLYSPFVKNYFIGDDFTWLRWAADCGRPEQCSAVFSRIANYFSSADGFFYRPGTKSYFLLMYSIFWLNPVAYHMVSLILHFAAVALVFLLVKKILGNIKLAAFVAFLFAVISGYSEIVFWIAATGHLFNAVFILLSILFFINWDEKRKIIYFVLSVLSIAASLLFHELGVVAPILILLYKFYKEESIKNLVKEKLLGAIMFMPVILYLVMRFQAKSHWQGGDYSYNLIKLPFNFFGNLFGYSLVSTLGSIAAPINDLFRNISRQNIPAAAIIMIVIILLLFMLYPLLKRIDKPTKKIIIFSTSFFVISLLPFLGLGNITSRYSYLASFGIAMLLALGIRKIHRYLLPNGREIASAITTIVIGIFFLLHVMQLQQVHGQWAEAGKKVNNFFISIEDKYENTWATDPIELHFVNVPIRHGEAWIFPVGLNDALWFLFRNPNLIIYQGSSVSEALLRVNNPYTQKVFVFEEDGRVIQKLKKFKTQ
jgi:hypothetical protein